MKMYPNENNYQMPAEWSRHKRTIISWPVKQSMCFPENYEEVCAGYQEIIEAISEFEEVAVLARQEELEVVKELFINKNVMVISVDHNDAWVRDNGPTFIKDAVGSLSGVNWQFNAWGEKYPSWEEDNKVASIVLNHFGIQRFDAPFVLEGGSIHSDGERTILTTEECLLNINRNPHLNKEEIEKNLNHYLGAEKVIWLERGLSGDETDGHVDNIACFGKPGQIILQVCEDPQDENYEITKRNLHILEHTCDAKGRKFEIIKIQQPPRVDYDGSRLTLSYLNFYFVNNGIILPVFGGTAEETDQMAVNTLQELFPDRRIRTVNGMAVIKEGGNVHCITQQMPE